MSFAAPMGSQFDSQHSRRNAGSFHVGVVSFRPFDRLHVGLASCVYGERAATTKRRRPFAVFEMENEPVCRTRRCARIRTCGHLIRLAAENGGVGASNNLLEQSF